MEVLIAIGKVLFSLFSATLIMGVFICFAGPNVDDVDIWYMILCLIIGITFFVIFICVMFSIPM